MDRDARLRALYGGARTGALPQTQQQQGTSGRGGPLTAFISELGGLGGAAGGAALGSMILPGVGTVIGAGLGGFLGGTGGSAVEQQVRDARIDTGKALREGVIEGAFSAGPIRGVRAVAQLPKALAKQGAKEAAESGVKASARRFSTTQLGKAWGIAPNAKTLGDNLSVQQANKLQRFTIDTLGVPRTANAMRVADEAETFANKIGQSIQETITTSRKPVTNVTPKLQSEFKKVIGKDEATDRIAQDIYGQVRNAKTPQQLWEVRKNIDDTLINFNRNAQGSTPGAETFARKARNVINKELDSIKGFSELNQSYSNAKRVQDLALAGTQSSKAGVNLPGTLGRMGAGIGQNIRAGVGQAVAGRPLAQRQLTGSVGRRAAQALPGQAVRTGMAASLNAPLNTVGQQQPLEGEVLQTGLAGDVQLPPMDTQQSQNPFAPQNLEATVFQILQQGGDLSDVQDAIQISQALSEIGGGGQQKLTQTQQQFQNNAISALNDLGIIRQQIGSDPSVATRAGLPGGSLTERLAGTGEFEAARRNVVDAIARLRSGAAITEDEAQRYAALLPSAFDTPELAESKLQRLESLLASFANPVPASAGTLEDAVLTAQGVQ